MANWIIPCNLRYYDVVGAFSKLKKLDWKQSAKNMAVGDYVYIYVANPIGAIRFKCLITKVNLPTIEIDDREFIINGDNYVDYGNHMELELVRSYEDQLRLDVLRELGLKGNIQGPCHMNTAILNYVEELDR